MWWLIIKIRGFEFHDFVFVADNDTSRYVCHVSQVAYLLAVMPNNKKNSSLKDINSSSLIRLDEIEYTAEILNCKSF